MSEDRLDSTHFNEKLDLIQTSLNKRLDQSAEDRHLTNNKVHVALHTLAQQTQNQDDVLAHLSRAVNEIASSQQQVADSVRRIEVRMVGDAALASTGLIQEQADMKVKIAANESRISSIEDLRTKDHDEYVSDKRFVLGIICALTALGGIVTWLQSSGAIHWIIPKA